jgi:hypothetical protein
MHYRNGGWEKAKRQNWEICEGLAVPEKRKAELIEP